MHYNRMRTARFSGPFHRNPPSSPLQRDIPPQRSPFHRDPPFHKDPLHKAPFIHEGVKYHTRDPFTETALERDPPGQRPSKTETPRTETPLEGPWDQGQRPSLTCENFTLPQTSFAGGKNKRPNDLNNQDK